MEYSENQARLATHLDTKKAGPLVCPICKATESFEPRDTLTGPPSDPLSSTGPRFDYATCTNCGYSMFFDAEATEPPE